MLSIWLGVASVIFLISLIIFWPVTKGFPFTIILPALGALAWPVFAAMFTFGIVVSVIMMRGINKWYLEENNK